MQEALTARFARQVIAAALAVASTLAAAQPDNRAVPLALKMSGPALDLAPSRAANDATRAQLRERRAVLEAGDPVSALLALRASLKQPGAAPKAEPVAPKPEPIAPKPPVAKLEPRPEPPPPVKVEPAPVARPDPVAKSEPAPAASPATVATTPAAPPANPSAGQMLVRPGPLGERPELRWGLAAGIAALLALLGLRWWVRRNDLEAGSWAKEKAPPEPLTELVPDEPIRLAKAPAARGATKPPPRPASAPGPAPAPRSSAADAAPRDSRAAITSDAALATRLPDESRELRRRYIEERYPEIVNRTISIEDPVSVVKGARLFYEDGALPRAVELLRFAIDDNPRELRPWLALFEIFRLERETAQFSELAGRFREHHGGSEYWRKVQYFGREIEPGNALYRDEPVSSLDTIGPRQARRIAAGPAAAAASFDPIAENWLDAPMDFENEVLANELRKALMVEAGLTEQDLVANPMPALRGVEMFTVA